MVAIGVAKGTISPVNLTVVIKVVNAGVVTSPVVWRISGELAMLNTCWVLAS